MSSAMIALLTVLIFSAAQTSIVIAEDDVSEQRPEKICHWPSGTVIPVYLNAESFKQHQNNLQTEALVNQVKNSLFAWNSRLKGGVQFNYKGLTKATYREDGRVNIYATMEAKKPRLAGLICKSENYCQDNGGPVACTTDSCTPESSEIVNWCDWPSIEFNMDLRNLNWSTTAYGEGEEDGGLSLWGVLSHELGHVLGLTHAVEGKTIMNNVGANLYPTTRDIEVVLKHTDFPQEALSGEKIQLYTQEIINQDWSDSGIDPNAETRQPFAFHTLENKLKKKSISCLIYQDFQSPGKEMIVAKTSPDNGESWGPKISLGIDASTKFPLTSASNGHEIRVVFLNNQNQYIEKITSDCVHWKDGQLQELNLKGELAGSLQFNAKDNVYSFIYPQLNYVGPYGQMRGTVFNKNGWNPSTSLSSVHNVEFSSVFDIHHAANKNGQYEVVFRLPTSFNEICRLPLKLNSTDSQLIHDDQRIFKCRKILKSIGPIIPVVSKDEKFEYYFVSKEYLNASYKLPSFESNQALQLKHKNGVMRFGLTSSANPLLLVKKGN